MKKLITFIFSILIFSIIFANTITFEQPVLITSAGQSAGVTMMKVLANRAGLQFTDDPLIKAESIQKDIKTIILVVGASSKGLGAAGIDFEQEKKRTLDILNKAKSSKMKVIVAHIEGESRRGKSSDELVELAVPFADLVLVTKAGNGDNFFNKISEKHKKFLIIVDGTSDIQKVLQQYFIPVKK